MADIAAEEKTMCHRTKQKKDITVIVNKEVVFLKQGMTIADLLEQRDAKNRASVWVNGTQLLIAEYPTYIIQEGDEIKILRVVAGG